MGYGWNQEKNAEVVFRQYLVGENPNELTQEFQRVQVRNPRCKRNTLSFVISPTIKDGQRMTVKDLEKVTSKFMEQMKLGERQAIAFVHRDKKHTHIHLYVNRIDFKGVAYNDSFVSKRSQQAAANVAEDLELTTVKQVQFERDFDTKEIKNEIQRRHELTLKQFNPRDFDEYIKGIEVNGVKIRPVINKQNQLQGFRFKFDGFDFKGSEVNRKMSMGNIGKELIQNTSYEQLISNKNMVKLTGKQIEISRSLAQSLAEKKIQRSISRGIGI
jgi:hypothetical protein